MRFMTVNRLDTCFLHVEPLRASIYLKSLNSGSGYISVEDMIEFPFLDIPDLSNVQQDGFGPPS